MTGSTSTSTVNSARVKGLAATFLPIMAAVLSISTLSLQSRFSGYGHSTSNTDLQLLSTLTGRPQSVFSLESVERCVRTLCTDVLNTIARVSGRREGRAPCRRTPRLEALRHPCQHGSAVNASGREALGGPSFHPSIAGQREPKSGALLTYRVGL